MAGQTQKGYAFSMSLAAHTTGREIGMKPIRVALLSAIGVAIGTMAQSRPARPLHAIVPVDAGSLTDVLARVVFEQVSPKLGQTIVVENKTGAGGTLGAAFVAKANPDGYTLLVHSSAHVIAPSLYPKLTYNPARDFSSVIPLGMSPHVLVVSPERGFKTVGDLVAVGKAKPLTFASVGAGTATHLSAERFRASAGIEAVHVPFRGGPQALTEVMSGRVDFFFGPVGLVLQHVQQGKLAALAVNGAQRSAMLPETPTTAEAGLANAEYPIWFGVFLPARTPRDIVDRLHDVTRQELQGPYLREKLAKLAVEPMAMSPSVFDAFVAKEIAVNAALIKMAGLKAE
jgi:tripartite-type tricarboxylate transporter receptor subunit TctC